MNLVELYAAVGGDYEDTVRRLCNEALVSRFVLKYPSNPSYSQLEDALSRSDWETAFRAAHTLKGVCQNLGFTRLYQASSALTEAMRGNVPLKDFALWEAVKREHKCVMDAIAQYTV